MVLQNSDHVPQQRDGARRGDTDTNDEVTSGTSLPQQVVPPDKRLPSIQVPPHSDDSHSAAWPSSDVSRPSLTKPSIGSGASSFVKDGGDAKQLANSAVSDRFGDSTPSDPSILSDRIDDDSRSFSSLGNRRRSGTRETFRPDPSPLEDALRTARLRSTEKDHSHFIPVNKLDAIITRKAILDELDRLGIGLEGDRPKLADRIWKTPRNQPEKTTRRKIFAVLVLIEKVDAIVDFIEEDIYDNQLPFTFSDNGYNLVGKGKDKCAELFQKPWSWKAIEKESFERKQWELQTPYFELMCAAKPHVNKYMLEDRAVLPYMEESVPSSDQHAWTDQLSWQVGGHSIVRKVKFHEAHFNSSDFHASENTFAVKTILPREPPNLDNREIKSLIRLNNQSDEHLIKLLAVFQHRDQLHLVFPWADGNLHDFWSKRYPSDTEPPRDRNLAIWMASQSLGLALGLQIIHVNPIGDPHVEEHRLQPDTVRKRHGLHGDLKPENILCFPSSDRYGVLKISDFGLTVFAGSNSRSAMGKLGMTRTYRAPEYDVRESLSPSYDIWCFGCVLLEFVEWYLRGSQGVEEFIQKRIQDSKIPWASSQFQFHEDDFFNFNETKKNALAKEAVRQEIHSLRHHEKSSDFILDLLDYIEDRLIKMNPEKRDSCDKVAFKLQSIYHKCINNPAYCTERNQVIRERVSTGLSELNEANRSIDAIVAEHAASLNNAIIIGRDREPQFGLGISVNSHATPTHITRQATLEIPPTKNGADNGSLEDPEHFSAHSRSITPVRSVSSNEYIAPRSNANNGDVRQNEQGDEHQKRWKALRGLVTVFCACFRGDRRSYGELED